MKIVKVNTLPQTYEADTIYFVKSSTAGLMDIYVTDSTGLEIRALPIDAGVIASLLPRSEVGVTAASLVDGKIPVEQLPSAILGTLSYKGTWDASINSPAIPTASAINKGWYYVVSVSGATNINGGTDWVIGDWIVSDGAAWGKVDNSDRVSSVAGKTGVVVLDKADVGLGGVDNTSDADKPISTATQNALNAKAPLADPTFTGLPKAPTAAVGTNTTQLATTAYVVAERAATATLTNKTLTTPVLTGAREVRVAMSANAIDLSAGNVFTKTISGATTFTVSNTPTTGTAASFILELTNAGSAAITWFSGVKWAGGTAPTLTAAGVDVLGFYSHDGGTTWRGMMLAKDSK